jgi:hypothetical protein
MAAEEFSAYRPDKHTVRSSVAESAKRDSLARRGAVRYLRGHPPTDKDAMIEVIAIALLAAVGNTHGIVPAAREVEIVGFDYAFRVPSELPAGRTTFRFVNHGKQRHEFNIVLLKSGATIQEFMAAANADKPVSPMVDRTVGVLFAEPGKRSAAGLSTELLAGRTYSIRCIFRDSPRAPRHQAMGMYSAIHISGAQPTASPPLRVDTIVGMDYAYRYPRVLSPGAHLLAFVNAGKQRHELSVDLLKKGVTAQKVMAVNKAGGDVDPLFDDGLGVLHSPGGTTPLGVLHVNLLPGREYMIQCEFSDTDKSPPHSMLGMYGSIKVSGKSQR